MGISKTIIGLLALVALLLTGCATGEGTVTINYKSNQHSDGSEVNQSTEAAATIPNR